MSKLPSPSCSPAELLATCGSNCAVDVVPRMREQKTCCHIDPTKGFL